MTLLSDSTAHLLVGLSLICFFVNITIILLFLVDPMHSLRRPSGYLVASLNLGAMLTSISSIIVSLPGLKDMSFFSVDVFFAIFAVAATASYTFIFILSYERYLLVSAPIKYKRITTITRVQILAVCVWIWAGAIGVFMFKMFTNRSYLWLSIPFGIGLMLMVGIDIKTFIVIKKINSSISNVTEEPQRTSVNQAIKNRIDMQSKFARVVVLLLLNFIFLASPIFVFHTMITLNQGCDECLFSSSEYKDGKFYAAAIIMFIFHDINTALFYIILIPKYRMSLVAIFRKWKTCFKKL